MFSESNVKALAGMVLEYTVSAVASVHE